MIAQNNMNNETNTDNIHFSKIGLQVPTILLPRPSVEIKKWAVIACDQYTSQPEYWQKAKELVGDVPSTLHLIYPEVYLGAKDRDAMIRNINSNMRKYLDEEVLIPQKPGFILIDRQTPYAKTRKGLLAALDLEQYDYRKGSQPLIRATEETILDRLPPRIRIRQNSAIELPHVMVLIDDPEKTVIEPLMKKTLKKLFDSDLMMNGGHIKGYKIDDKKTIHEIASHIEKLGEPERFREKYGVENKDVLLYAIGDGNHSLGTAKTIWEQLKQDAEDKDAIMSHPARFALVEIVNLHDEGLVFEPIHRVVFKINTKNFWQEMESFYQQQNSPLTRKIFDNHQKAVQAQDQFRREGGSVFSYVQSTQFGLILIENAKSLLDVENLQAFLDYYTENNSEASVDYIHGDDTVTDLGSNPDNIGFYLPAMSKHDLFKTVILEGTLPRKTFSMGHADEKCFYLGCRKIVQ